MIDDAYSQSGVSIESGRQATELMKAAVQATYNESVLSDVGSFGGLFSIESLKTMTSPVLVASTDGVGTKTMVAAKMGRWDTIGQDIVNHCVNDILVQAAHPLFFLDYVASSHLNPEQIAAVVGGCATACREIGCALLGGETAEMPGVYQPGEIDLAGTVVGVVDKSHVLDGARIEVGDVILNLPSSGLHTNGYSLARKVLADLDWFSHRDDLSGQSIGDALLAIHRCYLKDIKRLWAVGIDVRGLAHITGGGVIDNLPRILHDGVGARIKHSTWLQPSIFTLIQQLGDISQNDMFQTFNMGLGMLVIVPKSQARVAQRSLLEFGDISIVGEIVSGDKEVQFID